MTSETRKPHPAPKAGEVVELAIKDLGNFEYDQAHGGNIPADVKEMTGTSTSPRGFMIPMDQASRTSPSSGAGAEPVFLLPWAAAQIQHTIVCDCPKGKAVGYCPDEIVVEGNLKVEEKKDDGYIVSIFGLGVTSVKPAATK